MQADLGAELQHSCLRLHLPCYDAQRQVINDGREACLWRRGANLDAQRKNVLEVTHGAIGHSLRVVTSGQHVQGTLAHGDVRRVAGLEAAAGRERPYGRC